MTRRTAQTPARRPNAIVAWLTGFGIPGLRADTRERRIYGLSGIDILVGTSRTMTLAALRNADSRRKQIRLLAEGGTGVEDVIVEMRLDHFAPFLEAYIEKHAARVFGEE